MREPRLVRGVDSERLDILISTALQCGDRAATLISVTVSTVFDVNR
jgi:hypothetical protein